MANFDQHIAWARRHAEAADQIEGLATVSTRGWVAVALFYSAAHLAHAVLASEPGLPERLRHPESHTGAEPHPGTNTVLRTRFLRLWSPYQSLFSESVAVRYSGRRVDEASLRNLRADFDEVRREARRLLEAAGQALEARFP